MAERAAGRWVQRNLLRQYTVPPACLPGLGALKTGNNWASLSFFDCTFTPGIFLFLPFFFLSFPSVGYCFCDERQFPWFHVFRAQRPNKCRVCAALNDSSERGDRSKTHVNAHGKPITRRQEADVWQLLSDTWDYQGNDSEHGGGDRWLKNQIALLSASVLCAISSSWTISPTVAGRSVHAARHNKPRCRWLPLRCAVV